MITFHWSTIVYAAVLITLLIIMFSIGEGDFDLRPVFIFFLILLFTAVWGGIFWW